LIAKILIFSVKNVVNLRSLINFAVLKQAKIAESFMFIVTKYLPLMSHMESSKITVSTG